MRAVLDVNVIISALISPRGTPAELLRRWMRGEFDLVASTHLMAELERALNYSKLASRIPAVEAQRVREVVQRSAVWEVDPDDPPRVASDPGDDYLIALAEKSAALLVTGDSHLLEAGGGRPILTARDFLYRLDRPPR